MLRSLTARRLIALALTLALMACGAPSQAQTPLSEALAPSAPKRITAAISGNAFTFYNKLNLGNGVGGIEDLEDMTTAGLANYDAHEHPRPQLSEANPTIENGLWKVSPDGRMELSWKIRTDARWQDGEPFTSQDLVFSVTVFLDPELPQFQDPTNLFAFDGLDTPDPNTVVTRWTQPFINADRLFTRLLGLPIPKHLLAAPSAEDKAGFSNLPYWGAEFMHAGAYRVKEFVAGSHVLLAANDFYVLGRPHIDEIDVRFIPDPNTLAANILSGAVDLSLGRGLSIGQAVEVRDHWAEGRMQYAPSNLTRIYPELDHPNPPVIGNVEFRRALLYATDRQQLIDTFQFGLVSVTESMLADVPENQDLNAGLPRYDYDPRRAQQLIEGLGYTRGADGFFRDAGGQLLTVEFRARSSDVLPQMMAVIADYCADRSLPGDNPPARAERGRPSDPPPHRR